jgi:NADPH:quinone reductase-like Zn-dependent oxidoreductase
VQLAKQAGLHVIATAGTVDFRIVRTLGADRVVGYKKKRFEDSVTEVDVVVDTVGGDTQLRSLRVLKPGGIPGIGCIDGSRSGPRTLRRASSVFLYGRDNRATEQDHRIVRQRKN